MGPVRAGTTRWELVRGHDRTKARFIWPHAIALPAKSGERRPEVAHAPIQLRAITFWWSDSMKPILWSIIRHSPMCNCTSEDVPLVGDSRPKAQARNPYPLRGLGFRARARVRPGMTI